MTEIIKFLQDIEIILEISLKKSGYFVAFFINILGNSILHFLPKVTEVAILILIKLFEIQ